MQESQPKIPAHQKHTCDSLSPYVGIIQIRFRVKASAYSQPACASTPFHFSVVHITCVMITCFQQQFYYTQSSGNCKRLFLPVI